MNYIEPSAIQAEHKAEKISIYDLDRTLLAKPTFTAFLIFAAKYRGKAIWWRALIWLMKLIGYKLTLYKRKHLKQFGLRLFVGNEITSVLALKFAQHVVSSDVQNGAARAIAADRAEGRMLWIASAAPDFYAVHIGELLGFDAVIATRHLLADNGGISHLIDGENCYGAEKLFRVKAKMADDGLNREACHIRFYSDHISDAPLLDYADEAFWILRPGQVDAGHIPDSYKQESWS